MKRILALAFALTLLAALPVWAETFTITLTNGKTLQTRYQPKQDQTNEGNIQMLTEFGNWISLPKEIVVDISAETESRGWGTVLNTTTIALGWAPNDAPSDGEGGPPTAAEALMQFLQGSQEPPQDFSVQQFVDIEDLGSSGGLPAAGVFTGGTSFPQGPGGNVPGEPPVIDQ
jgi:hypothetical protein